jgi:Staphylococcal nuclease homologue
MGAMRRGAGLAILSWDGMACFCVRDARETLRPPHGHRRSTSATATRYGSASPAVAASAPGSSGSTRRRRTPTRSWSGTSGDRETILALGRQASAFARRLLPEATPVALEHDLQIRDRRGRLLAYLWTTDGAMVNLVILREGYAQVLTTSSGRAVTPHS